MNADLQSRREIIFSTPQVLALIISAVTIGGPSFLYWQLGSSLFGQNPLLKVFAISGIGGILSFALYGGRRRWLTNGVLGLFGGIGASGLLLLYTMVFPQERMWTGEIALVQVAGAVPAIALLAYTARRDRLQEYARQRQSLGLV